MAKTTTAPRAGTGVMSITRRIVDAVRERRAEARTAEALSRLTRAQREDIGLVGSADAEPRRPAFLLALM